MADFIIKDKRFSYDQGEFNAAFKEKAAQTPIKPEATKDSNPKAIHEGSLYSTHLSDLGWRLQGLWTEAKGYRRHIEDRWLDDIRQYRGEYPPEVKARMHPKRSKAFLRLTRTKVKTINARLGDILFPGGINHDKNWGIEPTPIPELSPDVIESLVEKITTMVPEGVEVTPEMVKQIVEVDAKARSDNMEQEIEDQLAEFKYRDAIRKVLHSGNLYGTGVLKGPLVKTQTAKRWMKAKDGTWKVLKLERKVPYCSFVPLWDIYPDMSATELDNVQYIFQRYLLSRNKVLKLANTPGFDGAAIKAYLDVQKDGDAVFENHESYLRNINSDNKGTSSSSTRTEGMTAGAIPALYKKYQLLEYWGYLSTDQLRDQGVDLPEEISDLQEVAANVWMLGPIVIKAILSPIEGVELPYYFYYFDKDETSLFGQGIAEIMRDPQELSNASVRALLDNAAISAGPIIEANIELLADGEDPLDIYPFRVFQRTGVGAEASQKAIHVSNQKAYTSEFLSMLNTFLTMGDEVTTIPRYMWGEASKMGQGAARTASGLSMLMGSANITLKDQVKNFDDGITRDFIESMYFWNMEFNPKEDIKGDYNVIAKGTNSLIAKEVKLESIIKYLQVISSFPEMTQTLDLKKLNDTLTEVLDMKSFSKSDIQIQQDQDAQQAAVKHDRDMAETLELIKAASGGHLDSQMLSSIMQRGDAEDVGARV